jgi:hypothetical protein
MTPRSAFEIWLSTSTFSSGPRPGDSAFVRRSVSWVSVAALVLHVAFDRGDDVRDQVVALLELRVDASERHLDPVLPADEGVVHEKQHRDDRHSDGCKHDPHDSTPPERLSRCSLVGMQALLDQTGMKSATAGQRQWSIQ